MLYSGRCQQHLAESNWISIHPNILQHYPQLRGSKHYGSYTRHHTDRQHNHRSSHSIPPTVVICARPRTPILVFLCICKYYYTTATSTSFSDSRINAQVTPGWNIPLNSVLVSLVVTALLSLINIGSNLALNAVISLTITSLMSAYILSIGCVLLKRLRGEKLPPRRWSLGRFGMGINIASLAFLFPIFVFSFFPLTKTVDAHSMNWSVVMYLPMVGFASVYYYFWGRYQFIAPVALVKRDIDLNDM